MFGVKFLMLWDFLEISEENIFYSMHEWMVSET